jgi:hypothetical protein
MDSLRLGRLELPLVAGEGGPVLAGTPPCPSALAAVVNSAVTGGSMKGLRQVIQRGERALSSPALTAARPYPEDDLDALKADWQAVTGEPANHDVYVLGVSWERRRFLVPRIALLSLLEKLEAIRARA